MLEEQSQQWEQMLLAQRKDGAQPKYAATF